MGLGRISQQAHKSSVVKAGNDTPTTAPKEPPTISVLVAVRNEELNIRNLLEALQQQDYPRERWEAIIIDDSSTDGTAGIVSEYIASKLDFKIIAAGTPPAGVAPKKNALNKGLEIAAGDVILATDADCIPGPGWVSGMAWQFSSEADAIVGYSPLTGYGLAGALGSFDAFVNAVVSAGTIGLGHPTTAVGRNFGYRKSVWHDVGGFGSTAQGASGDDDLLLQRIAANGGKVVFSSEHSTVIQSTAKPTIAEWWRMKRRHLSAGKRYQPKLVLFSSALYLFQVGLLLITGLATFGKISPVHVFAIWGLKALVDWLALFRGAKLLRQRQWIVAFLAGEVISPILFTVLVPISLIGKVKWKGRTLDN